MSSNIEYILPVKHLSYSALKTYCANRAMFKKKYILHQYDDKTTPSMILGKMCHLCVQAYLEGAEWDAAMQLGYDMLDKIKLDEFVNPETVDLAKIKKDYAQAVAFWFEEKPEIGKLIGCEIEVTTDFEIDGSPAPLAIKAVSDLVSEINGGVHIFDWKFTKLPRKVDEEQPDYILQAVFNYIAIKAKTGKAPTAMHYVQIKTSKNRDNGPQVQIYTIDFAKHPEYFSYFNKMYTGFIYEIISSNVQFLPNFSDYLSGKEAWNDFIIDAIDFDLPENISHESELQKNKVTRDNVDFLKSKVNEVAEEQAKISSKLIEFGINIKCSEKHVGKNVTMYTFEPSRGITMAKVKSYEADIELALAAKSVIIHAPLKGTSLIGIEVANKQQTFGSLPKTRLGGLKILVGEDVFGKEYSLDISDAPHMLVAGTTGSGKSIFLESVLNQVDAKKYIIDPKGTEFAHIGAEVYATEVAETSKIFTDLVTLMQDRQFMFANAKVKNIDQYNAKSKKKLSKIVVVVDELGDLLLSKEYREIEVVASTESFADMKTTKTKVIRKKYAEIILECLIKLAQKSRSVGIHLVLATQRPSVDVVPGILKANLPVRVCFRVVTGADSLVVLDQTGGEKLMGKGDVLVMSPSQQGLQRLQSYNIK